MTNPTHKQKYRERLMSRPREHAVLVAVRASLRMWRVTDQYMGLFGIERGKPRSTLSFLRAYLSAGVACFYPDPESRRAAEAAGDAVAIAVTYNPEEDAEYIDFFDAAQFAAGAAAAACRAATATDAETMLDAIYAADVISSDASEKRAYVDRFVSRNTASDIASLDGGEDLLSAPLYWPTASSCLRTRYRVSSRGYWMF